MNQPHLIDQLAELANALQDYPQKQQLLNWAILHIKSQNEALADMRQELADEEAERLRLENAMHQSQQAIETALQAIRYGQRADVEISRDMSGHINLMAGHGDPDYMMKNGQSVRHIDLRQNPSQMKRPENK